MMPDFLIPVDSFIRFVLVFFRIGGILVFAPFYNQRVFSASIKISLALVFSFMTFPLLVVQTFTPPREVIAMAFAILRELMIGIVIGYAAQLLFTGIQYAGELISTQMGFSLATIIDPNFNNQSTVVAQLYNFLALLIFISLEGHHFLIRATIQTFDFVPLAGFEYSTDLGRYLLSLFANIFTVAFRISVPVLMTLFLTSLAMGLMGRTIPQMNIFMISPPLQIAVGLVMIVLSLTVTVMMFKFLFTQLERDLHWMIANM